MGNGSTIDQNKKDDLTLPWERSSFCI